MAERFWSKVSPLPCDPGCWVWIGALRSPKGYGAYWTGTRRTHAHRAAYEGMIGPVPSGLQIDHLCRTPQCVNPAHLEAVTARENVRRGRSYNLSKTRCPRGHAYDEPNTIRRNGKRICRECARIHGRSSPRRDRREYMREWHRRHRSSTPPLSR